MQDYGRQAGTDPAVNALLGTRVAPALTHRGHRHELRRVADVGRAEAELGFCPGTDLAGGLRRCLDFLARRREEVMQLQHEHRAGTLPGLAGEAGEAGGTLAPGPESPWD